MTLQPRRQFLGDCCSGCHVPRGTSLGDTPTIAISVPIGQGNQGTIDTLRLMKQMANASVKNPAQIVRLKALQILEEAGVEPRDYMGEVVAFHDFVKQKIKYVRDPTDWELVTTPEKTLELGREDCDGKATLLAALLKSTGHSARFVAVGFDNGPFSHVLTLTGVGKGWLPLETIIDKPPGWFPPDTTSKYFMDV